ncbi:MAG TPA: phosphate ABC transporter ATP-binding protein [Acidobacteriaceae bacterium]|nr:phosphate ABC transporter ATP-binding protein [Acidobacteriaceae bacterium]
MNSPVLECDCLTREVPGVNSPLNLVQDIAFQLERGQVLAILGPSGAGKTTLLRMLNRLDEPTAGRILLNGQDTRTLPTQELRRHIGMVMQRAYLFPGTITANIRYGPAQRGEWLQEAQVEALLEQVGLPETASRDVQTLSGGEAQRVAIARALANNPEVLLLDEPTSALDDAAKQSVERLLASIVHARHLTCVWVTHDRAQARRVADCVLLLEAGRATAFGTPEELLDAPEGSLNA